MEKFLKITTLKEPENNYDYWSTKSYIERLATIELLRQQYFSLKKDVQPRFQRICTIANKA